MKNILALLSVVILCSFTLPWQWKNYFSTQTTHTYYISTSGSDSYTATQAQNPATPWKSFAPLRTNQSNSTIANGDSVLLKCGDTFADSIILTKGITLASYSTGNQPVISGFVTATGWTSLGGNIWESAAIATSNTVVNIVAINGQPYEMGRTPNANAANGGYLTFESHTSTSITDNTNPFTSNRVGAQIIARTQHYNMGRATIGAVSGSLINFSPSISFTDASCNGYFINNDSLSLDQFGEWYFNPSTKKIRVYFGSGGVGSNVVQVSTKNILIEPRVNNITVSNIRLEGANKYGIWNDWSGVRNLSVNDCYVNCSGIDGILLANRYNFSMSNTTVNWSNSCGVSVGYQDSAAVIDNSHVYNTGLFLGMLIPDDRGRIGNAIFADGQTGYRKATITNSDVANAGLMGIFASGDNILVQNNSVDSFCLKLDDGGGIYTGNFNSDATIKNIQILNNIVTNGIGNFYGTTSTNLYPEAYYLDDNSIGVTVQGNTAAYCNDNGVYLHNARKNTVRYNIFFNNFKGWSFQHDHVGTFTVDSNIVHRNQIFAYTASQSVGYMGKETDFNEAFGTFADLDSNYYDAPLRNEANIIQTNWFGHTQPSYNLAGWRTASGDDANTSATPITITDPAKITFNLNKARQSKTIRFCVKYLGVDNTAYTRSATVNSLSSLILLKNQ